MPNSLKSFLAVSALCVGATAAQASLIGDTITISHYYPHAANLYETHNVVVAAGTGDATGMLGAYVVNPEANSVLVTFHYGASNWSTTPFNGLVLSGIDDAIMNVTVSTNFAGWSNARLTFTDHTIAANWESLLFDNNTYFNLAITQAETTPVPESGATAVLVGAALMGGLAIRRARFVRG